MRKKRKLQPSNQGEGDGRLKFPVLLNRLDGPLELLTQRLGEELFDGDVILLAEDDSEARINVVLMRIISW